jgi:8-oxo-dGTP pyrophosphatase MutT (NUDIX family)
MHTTVSVLIIRNNKYVLQYRDNIDSIAYPNTYGVWGGAVEEQDFSNKAAAVRELQEEIGLVIKESELIPLGSQTWDGKSPKELGNRVKFYYFALHIQVNIDFDVYEGRGYVELEIPYTNNNKVNVVTAAVIKRYELQQTN